MNILPAARPRATGPISPVDEVPRLDRMFFLGAQHVLAMYAGCVAVPIIVGGALGLDQHIIALLVNADLLVAGIATFVQAAGVTRLFGARLPVVTGATFTAVPPMIAIGANYGLPAVYGSMLAAGVLGILIAGPFSKLMRFFPPVVSGTVITVLGLSLIGAGVGLVAGHDPTAPDYASTSYLLIACLVIAGIIVMQRFGRGGVSQLAVFAALVIGTVALIPFGMVDFSGVGDVGWLGFSTPFIFGAPQFEVAAILSMCTVLLITYTETTADIIAIGEIVDQPATPPVVARGLRTDGLAFLMAGFLNSFPDSTFVQNIGLLRMTGVKSRWVVAMAGGILILLGLVPKVGAIVAAIPGPVIGGAALLMFALVAAFGMQMLRTASLDNTSNIMIVSTGIALGMMPVVAPSIYSKFPEWFQTIFGTPLTATVIVAFLLNLLLNTRQAGKGTGTAAGIGAAVGIGAAASIEAAEDIDAAANAGTTSSTEAAGSAETRTTTAVRGEGAP
jgi:xanthine permease